MANFSPVSRAEISSRPPEHQETFSPEIYIPVSHFLGMLSDSVFRFSKQI